MEEEIRRNRRIYMDPSYQRAYDQGFTEGYDLGYRRGMKDSVSTQKGKQK